MNLNRIALAALIAAPLSVAAHADTTGLGVTVTPMVGYHWFDNSYPKDVKAAGSQTIPGLAPYGRGFQPDGDVIGAIALGYELTPSLSVEAQYDETNNDGTVRTSAGRLPGDYSSKVRTIEGNFLLNSDFITKNYDSKFKPYVLVGAGNQDLNMKDKGLSVKSNDTIGNLGLGAFYRINDALAVRGEGRMVENFDHSLIDWKTFLGLQITLGGHKRPYVAPAPVEVPPPAPVVVAPAPAPVPAPQVEELKMELRVFFDTNKSVIKKQYQPEVGKVADKLKDFPNATAEIRGYTDSTGPKKLNDRLSQARADAVKTSLIKDYGIDAGRLTAKGYSWNDPVASNKTVEGRALNRRVVAMIAGTRTVQQ